MKKSPIILVLILCAHTEAFGQWVQTSGPTSPQINSLGFSGVNLFAGSDLNGLFLSTNLGLSWSKDTSRLLGGFNNNIQIFSFANIGNEFFAASAGQFFSSSDNGVSWQEPEDSGAIGSQVIVNLNEDLFIVYGGAVYRSTNSGVTWTWQDQSVERVQFDELAVLGNNLFAYSTDSGLYTSTDNGANWSQIKTPNSPWAIFEFGNALYGSTGSAIVRSIDRGLTWISVDSLGTNSITSFASNGSLLFAITSNNHILRSEDSGQSWVASDNGVTAAYIFSLIAADSILILATDVGIYRSTDSGQTWDPSNVGLQELPINGLAVSNFKIFAGSNENSVFGSPDEGGTWSVVGSNAELSHIYSLGTLGDKLYAGSYFGIYRRGFSDTAWTFLAFDSNFYPFVNTIGIEGNIILAGYGSGRGYASGISVSMDSGNTWISAIAPPLGIISSFSGDGNRIFATTDFGIAESTDKGISWVIKKSSPDELFCVAVNGSTIFAGSKQGLFKSVDDGSTWIHSDSTIIYPSFGSEIQALTIIQNNVFAATGNDVLLSKDNGSTWISEGIGLAEVALEFATNGTDLFAGTDEGVWRRPLSEMINTSAVEVPTNTETSISAYPNPFSQSTQITFTSQSAGYAEVSIVNMLGVEVARLFSGELVAGEHSFNWDAGKDACTTGTYECIVRMNGQVDALPVELMR